MQNATSYDDTVIKFAAALANQRQIDLDTLHPRARVIVIGPFATNNPDSYSKVLCEWLMMGDAAANALPRTPDNLVQVRRISQDFISQVFSFPGHVATEPPDAFHSTAMGRVWDMARLWLEDGELITVGDAAIMCGVSIPAISQNRHLTTYRNPLAPKHQGGRLVKRSEVAEYYKEKIK